MDDYVSIVLVQFRHGKREAVAKKCFDSLLNNTTYPYELILIDNTQNNRGFSDARNLGVSMATGKYLCIMDDDILVNPNWMETCIGMLLETDGNKYLVTPIHQRNVHKWELPNVNGYRCNYRTGSNCMIGRREAFEKIGKFPSFKQIKGIGYEVPKAGMTYANITARAGYQFLITKEPMAYDMGLHTHSYNE
jgi:glycosyltransferase involved in cell wall biosynthesis